MAVMPLLKAASPARIALTLSGLIHVQSELHGVSSHFRGALFESKPELSSMTKKDLLATDLVMRGALRHKDQFPNRASDQLHICLKGYFAEKRKVAKR
jgi:hypothetical protein